MPTTAPQHTFVTVYQGEPGETVQLASLLISEVEMPGFQRDRKRYFIDKVAAEPDKTAFVFPIVAYFKGHYICIDGQQRLAGWEQKGDIAATVLLIGGITKQERLAEIYLKINRDRKLLDAFEKFIGAVAAKDRGTLEIERVAGEFNLEISRKASASGKIPAGATTQIYSRGGPDLLRRVLRIRELSWGGNGAHETNEGRTLLGLASFVRRYDEKIDDDRLIKILRKNHPGYILTAVQRHEGGELSYSDFLREEDNNGLRGPSRL
jgi:Family of unknown function (DUF6551)